MSLRIGDKMRRHNWVYYCLIIELAIVYGEFSSDVLVEISSGILKGTLEKTWTKKNYLAFKGIPYAQPPIGKLRFKEPISVKPWTGIRNATEDGKVCPQKDREFVVGPVDEDCLYLNVYTQKIQGNQPVIVWIHPGGFRFMTGASYWYGPDYLLDHEIVLVSFNYRLDILGFMSTGDESSIGNYGMKDQVEVLKWVQKNIQKFGGNPQRVTLAGDSAGSAAVFLHMLSPMSTGLFHRAIAMSGGIVGNMKWQRSQDQLEMTEKLSKLFNCPIKPISDMVECLRNIPPNELIDKQEEFEIFSGNKIKDFGPVIELHMNKSKERFLTDHPLTLLKRKNFQSVPVMTGFTAMEFIKRGVEIAKNKTLAKKLNDEFDELIPVLFEYDNKNEDDIKNITKSIRKYYFGNNTINISSAEALGDMFSDFGINFGEYATAKLLSQFSDNPVYFYKFSYTGRYGQENDPITNKTLGPGHTNDISYVLYPSKLFPKFKENDPEAATVKTMTTLWYNFASTGNPTPSGSRVIWHPITHGKYIDIDKTLTTKYGFPYSERMKLWESFYPIEA